MKTILLAVLVMTGLPVASNAQSCPDGYKSCGNACCPR